MTPRYALAGAAIFDGEAWHEGRSLLVSGDTVSAIVPVDDLPDGTEITELDGGVLAPGFVDLQVNGGGGVLLNDAPGVETITRICAAHFAFGTTALLPTLITDTPEVTRAALAAGIAAHRQGVRGFAGLHIEGPHLSIARKGAHDPALIRPMEQEDLDALVTARKALPTLLTTVAVESVTPEQISALSGAGVVVSLGHTDASCAAARTAFSAGASMVTHLFNAMSQLGNREPGLVGAALTSGVWAGLIADGLHVDPAAMAIALRAKTGPGRIVLVTDAMTPIGTDMTRFTLNGREIMRENGALRLSDGTLAGADLTMIDAVRHMHRIVGVGIEEALRMASLYPAQAIGRADRLGCLKPGAAASMVHLSQDLDIAGVWVDGRPVAGQVVQPPSMA